MGQSHRKALPGRSMAEAITGRRPAGKRVVVIGAGIGGLSAAIAMASAGLRVTLIERESAPGGKMREIRIGDSKIDSGPTVLTMRGVFEELFANAGEHFAEHVPHSRLEVLARHSWLDGGRLDIFSDLEQTVSAVAEFAGAREADAYRKFAGRSQTVFEALDQPFMRAEKPGPAGLVRAMGIGGFSRLLTASPYRSLWNELGRIFHDPRLRQLFGRYATYCGSSPFEAPATLMLIAHAERAGVWAIEGGMQRLAEALSALAVRKGVVIHYGSKVEEIIVQDGSAKGAELDDGRIVHADAVVFNGDIAALSRGLLGRGTNASVPDRKDEPRSLSAVTWSLVGECKGFPLSYHTVFFGEDYEDEFSSLFDHQRICRAPTVYVCARDWKPGRRSGDSQRLFVIVNAPARELDDDEVGRATADCFNMLGRHGLDISCAPDRQVVTTPGDFARRFPGSDGALYGWPTHGAMGSFKRQGSRSQIPGLYLAGGTVHPGPGIPMAALSGRLAASSVLADLA